MFPPSINNAITGYVLGNVVSRKDRAYYYWICIGHHCPLVNVFKIGKLTQDRCLVLLNAHLKVQCMQT